MRNSSLKKIYTHLIITLALLLGNYFFLAKSVLTAPTPPGTNIDNSATGSFDGETSGTTGTVTSNTVTVQVLEVAGISITNTAITEAPTGVTNAGTYQGIAGINTGDVVYFDFTISNDGNDPTKFFIPNNAQITGGTLQGNVQIIAVDPDGSTGATPEKVLTTPVNVVTGNDTIALLGSPDGYIPPGGTVKVRVPVKVTETTVGSNISVTLGNTTPVNSQNIPYVDSGSNNDVYTVDFADGTAVPSATGYNGTTAESAGNPANGDATNHRQEASNTQSIALVETPVIQGFKSVKLTGDLDTSNSVSANDELTWTISYKNTSGVAITNFQISDTLDPNTTRTGASAITINVKDGTGATISSPTLNGSYTGGTSPNNNLLASGYNLPANATITINVPVKILNGTANNTLISNQTQATGDNLPTAGFLTDNIDNTTTGLPNYVTVPTSSISQNQLASIDPTVAITGIPTLQGFKSVKLTTDNGTTGLNPGDVVTWTVIYKNTGTVDIPNFQITDSLPTGVQRNASAITISATGSGQSTPTANSSYNGTGTNTLFQNPVTLKAGAVIVVNIPVDIKAGTAGTSQNNQAIASGSNLSTPVNTDNVDSDTTGITEVPLGSIKQTQTATIDPTVINIPTTPGPIISGYKSVKSTDTDTTGTITPGDTLTWTVTYINTGTVDATGFQINDTLPSGLTVSGPPTITTNTTQGAAPNANTAYTGASPNTTLLENPITLKAGGIITVTVPVTINTGVTGDKLNQAIASGTNITDTNTDNVDSTTTGLPTGLTVPVSSVTQTQIASIDPTKVTIVSPPSANIFGYKSVKLTTDADTSNSVTPGDTVTWTVIYKNTGTVATSNFQITDTLPSGVTISGTPTVTVTGGGQTTPTIDNTYNGTTNTNLFSTAVPLQPGGVIAVKIPVTINANQVGNKSNQALGNGTLSDNVDDLTSGLAADILAQIESGSIDQNEQGTIDPTLITIPEVKGFKSVKLTNDVSPTGVTQNDQITWTVIYKNTGNTDIPNFQITDSLPVGVSYSSGITITTNTTQGGTITDNSSYNGTGNNTLFNAAVTLKAGGVITVNIPVTINVSSGTLSNQSTANGDILPTVGIKSDNVDNTTTLPTDVTVPASSITQTQIASIDPTTVTVTNVVSGTPNVLLVKRITAINGTPINTVVDPNTTTDPNDNNANWPNSNPYLRGAISQSNIKPGDEIEYTIYFLSTGSADVTNVTICDLIPANTTFVPNSFGASKGIALGYNTTALADPNNPNIPLTNVVSDDRGEFYPAAVQPPTSCRKPDPGNPPNYIQMTQSDNNNGLVIINIAKTPTSTLPDIPVSTIPKATGSGTPFGSYGYVRFRVKVN